ncbi:MAG: hypothetical protein ACE5ID_05810 [Acidobacteriota bacterium]
MRFTLTRVGVLLAGCGTHDGSEAAEAILVLLHLERLGVKPIPLVPPGDQMHVVDHASGDEVEGAVRRMSSEAARLTRGKMEILGERPWERLHALIIPGGSGVPKNLMSGFLQPGVRRDLRPEVKALLMHCLDRGKPIGLMNVANFLLQGLVESPILPRDAGSMGEELADDPAHRLVYAPTFLGTDSLAQVAAAVSALVEKVLQFAMESRTKQTGAP